MQRFGWAVHHNAFRARVGSIPAVFAAAAVDLGRSSVTAEVVRAVWDKLLPGLLTVRKHQTDSICACVSTAAACLQRSCALFCTCCPGTRNDEEMLLHNTFVHVLMHDTYNGHFCAVAGI